MFATQLLVLLVVAVLASQANAFYTYSYSGGNWVSTTNPAYASDWWMGYSTTYNTWATTYWYTGFPNTVYSGVTGTYNWVANGVYWKCVDCTTWGYSVDWDVWSYATYWVWWTLSWNLSSWGYSLDWDVWSYDSYWSWYWGSYWSWGTYVFSFTDWWSWTYTYTRSWDFFNSTYYWTYTYMPVMWYSSYSWTWGTWGTYDYTSWSLWWSFITNTVYVPVYIYVTVGGGEVTVDAIMDDDDDVTQVTAGTEAVTVQVAEQRSTPASTSSANIAAHITLAVAAAFALVLM